MLALARQIVFETRDPELTFLAAMICIPAVVLGSGICLIETVYIFRFRDVQNVIIRLHEIYSKLNGENSNISNLLQIIQL